MALKIAPNFIKDVWGINCKGMLGMVHAPGRYKPHQPEIIRNLEQDLKVLKQQYGMQTLVSLIQQKQLPIMRIQTKTKLCEKLNIKNIKYPIADFSIPVNKDSFQELVKQVVDTQIKRNKTVIAHCKAGLGRTGLFASACLIYAGFGNQQAIQLVRKIRRGTIQTQKQVQFVKSLKF